MCIALNNPLKYIDPLGMDTVQRNQAITKAEEYVSKKKTGNHYLMGGTGGPGVYNLPVIILCKISLYLF